VAFERAAWLERRYGAEVQWLPFDLHPEYPPGGVPRTRLEQRYGTGFLDHVRNMVEAAGLVHAPPTHVPRSLASLQLAEVAREEEAHGRVHPRLFRAYWAEGRDIGDLEVLASVAEAAGIDADKALEAIGSNAFAERIQVSTDLARQVGVNAVPAWLIDESVLVVGAQPHDAFAGVLEDMGYEPLANQEE
jgi:predicted DsbA family dithiol-disulfide isomerase